ncbi:hypothetical protein L1987_70869 [Smallanthus sonchifolius]|uniref:Uncharacterized protein n=1 Tax=Smallanthus sonchifolius TaxID=185202 RepID=A0ACB9AR63_9ASTR|nr:hypothetical protein L1987_70869 [Smallanthus sonchifolius]
MGRHWCNISLVLTLLISVHLSHAHEEGSKPDDYVNQHNCIRRVLGLPPLTWDPELEKKAQAWADVRKDCQMIHSEGGGENMAKGPNLNGLWAVQMWVDERPNYDLEKNECTAMCGHYTQVIWKSTEKVGCGRSKCNDGSGNYMIVCNYSPPGNYIGQRPF